MNRLFGIGQPKYGYNTYDREIHFDQGSTYLKFRPGEELMLEMVRSALLQLHVWKRKPDASNGTDTFSVMDGVHQPTGCSKAQPDIHSV